MTAILPAVVVFGLGLTLVASPVTSTALAAVDARHAGLASGINISDDALAPARAGRPEVAT